MEDKELIVNLKNEIYELKKRIIKEVGGISIMEEETREFVMDYLNGHNSEEELALKFDLKKCPICENYNLEEDMTTHKGDIGEHDEFICEDCRNNERNGEEKK